MSCHASCTIGTPSAYGQLHWGYLATYQPETWGMQGSGLARRVTEHGQALSAATAAAQSRAMLLAVGSGQPPAKKRRHHRELQSLLLDQVQ